MLHSNLKEDLVDYLKMRMEANLSEEKLLGMMEVSAHILNISVDDMYCLVEGGVG